MTATATGNRWRTTGLGCVQRLRSGLANRWRAMPVLIGATLTACGGPGEYHRTGGPTMGTEYRVIWSGGVACTKSLAHRIETELQSVNGQMSTYLADSELSRFNRAPAGEWLPVSVQLADVVVLALHLSNQSGGAFDITVGPLVNLWGFGPEQRTGTPTDREIDQALTRVGFELLEVRRSPPGLRKRIADLYVDLSAIAKGHAVDRLAVLLEDHDCSDYLVDIGGELRVRGTNAAGESWRIGIESPQAGAGGIEQVLSLSRGALATSGDYRNFRMSGDGRLSHTIDPRTGRPVAHPMASVTVWAETAALADGLATLINVLGPTAGMAFAEHRDTAAMALVRRDGGFDRRYTDRMRELLDGVP